MIKRHTRPNPSKNVKGGIVEKEGTIAISNVLLFCPACNKGTRLGHKGCPMAPKSASAAVAATRSKSNELKVTGEKEETGT